MAGIDTAQLKSLVVRPALACLGPIYSTTAAVNLVTGTALAESGAAYLRQIGGGPARGLWQMEPATEDDIWANFLRYEPDLAGIGDAIRGGFQPESAMVWNLLYGVVMCRLKYWRSPDPLPAAADAIGMADYHKAVYNTVLGAADAARNIAVFQDAIDA